MLPVVVLVACLASVPLAGGRLDRLGDLRFRGVAGLVAVLLVQILILVVLPGGDHALLAAVYTATMAAAVAFIFVNRRVPGVPLIGLGGALNAVAIVANDGQMPARPGALVAAGRPVDASGFQNSAAVAHPHLGWLGDTFAIPSGVPLSNVFSVGDVVIVVGVLVLLHVTCGSRRPRLVRRPARAGAT